MSFFHSITQKHMRSFLLLWLGQLLSILGSGTTSFATTLWAWEKTAQATPLAMIAFFFMLPVVMMTPIAGVVVDRCSRKLVMAISDLAAGVGTLFMLTMLLTNNLQIWHLYLTATIAGLGNAFQFPAYSAAITLMVPKEEYARTAGMISMAESASSILAPLLGALLYTRIGLTWVLVLDLCTLFFALLMLAIVYIPPLSAHDLEVTRQEPFFSQLTFGMRFVFRHKPLLYLQLLFLVSNFFSHLGNTMSPMILVKTANNAGILANATSASAVGALLGGALITLSGGPKRKVIGVIGGWFLYAFLGMLLFALSSSALAWMLLALFGHMFIIFVNGSNQAIWQTKVPPSIQGRVFAFRALIARASIPIALAISGPLADRFFEPALVTTKGGFLAGLFPAWLGIGAAGSGYALQMALSGAIIMIAALLSWANPFVRHVEALLPDVT